MQFLFRTAIIAFENMQSHLFSCLRFFFFFLLLLFSEKHTVNTERHFTDVEIALFRRFVYVRWGEWE